MILVHCGIILTLIVCCLSETGINEISQGENDKLDGNLRKALQQAIDELQSEKLSNATVQKVSSPSVITSFLTTSAVQTSIPATVPEAASNQSQVIIQKSNGYQHKPVVTFVPTSIPQLDPLNDDAEQIIISATSSFTRSPKYQSSKDDIAVSKPFIEKYNKNLVSITEKSRITSSTSATTTTPIITSSTEESEAKVENIQFFQAPLVAAFTVHHDDVGLPEKVEPLYRVSTQRSVTNQNSNAQQIKQLENFNFKQESQTYQTEQIKLQQYLHYQEQIRLQRDLQEKQKLIEQQIQKLQQQQYHQDYSLRQQQLIQEQKLLQQRQSLLDQQKLLLKNVQINSPATLNNYNSFGNPIENRIIQNYLGKKIAANSVTLQPSVSFQPTLQLHNTLLPPLRSQNLNNHPEIFLNSQLPPLVSNNINFRQSQNQITSNFNPGNLQQLLPPFKSIQNNFETIKSVQNAYNFQTTQRPNNKILEQQNLNVQFFNKPKVNSFQSIRGLENFDLGQNIPESNRVFRHETGTGNFVNNNYNNGNNAFTIPQSNRYFRSNSHNFGNYYTNQNFRPEVDENLNRLLYNSGINLGKQNEDLNIVSKILSLNHLGADNYITKSHYLKPIYSNAF